MKNLNVLGIETSCDDTCIAILKIGKRKLKILSNVISSQVKLHAKYGGVYPFLAKREHQKNLPIILEKSLKKANLTMPEIDLITVTVGPGLEPCLWTGINFAKELAKKTKLSIVPVNHIESHIIANFINEKKKITFPAVCLVVSGGHTQIILMKKFGDYKIIGETRDDAAGECFDKSSRVLGLGYPGGPAIAKEAARYKTIFQKSKNNLFSTKKKLGFSSPEISLPRPMIYTKDYDFSFSGLKTAVLYDFKSSSLKRKEYTRAMAAEIQRAIIDVLIHKTSKAAKDYKVKAILLSGGVSANNELRKRFELRAKELKIDLFIPEKIFCTDNAVMTALTGYLNFKKRKNWKKIAADANLKIDKKL